MPNCQFCRSPGVAFINLASHKPAKPAIIKITPVMTTVDMLSISNSLENGRINDIKTIHGMVIRVNSVDIPEEWTSFSILFLRQKKPAAKHIANAIRLFEKAINNSFIIKYCTT